MQHTRWYAVYFFLLFPLKIGTKICFNEKFDFCNGLWYNQNNKKVK